MIPWQPPPSHLKLALDELHVWRVSLANPPFPMALLWRQLNPEELTRAQHYRFERDRRRFVIARGMLRVILARYTGIAPAAIQFEYSDHGKPRLPAYPDIAFNASDSGELMALGVARNRLVGVDIEKVREDFAGLEIADRFFSPREVAVLRSLSPIEQRYAFFRCWTRKEAFIKAIGEGLSFPLHQFDVTLRPGAPALLLRVEGDPNAPERWWMSDFPIVPDYAGAIMAEKPITTTLYWAWENDSGLA